MSNQDEIARLLIKCTADRMHTIMFEYGTTGDNRLETWPVIFSDTLMIAHLLYTHGWTVSEYTAECVRMVDTDILSVSKPFQNMMKAWLYVQNYKQG